MWQNIKLCGVIDSLPVAWLSGAVHTENWYTSKSAWDKICIKSGDAPSQLIFNQFFSY